MSDDQAVPLPPDAIKAAAMVLCEMAYPGSSNGWHRRPFADLIRARKDTPW